MITVERRNELASYVIEAIRLFLRHSEPSITTIDIDTEEEHNYIAERMSLYPEIRWETPFTKKPTDTVFEITAQELNIMNYLILVWNSFCSLPIEHADDTSEFRHILHDLQRQILSRPTRRAINARK